MCELKRKVINALENLEYYDVVNENCENFEAELIADAVFEVIADYLKGCSAVVVNLKRVTPDQAKRIVDFLYGTIYAIGGSIQKLGGGIFLCTPNNVNVEGNISEDNAKTARGKKDSKDDEEDFF